MLMPGLAVQVPLQAEAGVVGDQGARARDVVGHRVVPRWGPAQLAHRLAHGVAVGDRRLLRAARSLRAAGDARPVLHPLLTGRWCRPCSARSPRPARTAAAPAAGAAAPRASGGQRPPGGGGCDAWATVPAPSVRRHEHPKAEEVVTRCIGSAGFAHEGLRDRGDRVRGRPRGPGAGRGRPRGPGDLPRRAPAGAPGGTAAGPGQGRRARPRRHAARGQGLRAAVPHGGHRGFQSGRARCGRSTPSARAWRSRPRRRRASGAWSSPPAWRASGPRRATRSAPRTTPTAAAGSGLTYVDSKHEGEIEALAAGARLGVEVVVVNPSYVLGVPVDRSQPGETSTRTIGNYLRGRLPAVVDGSTDIVRRARRGTRPPARRRARASRASATCSAATTSRWVGADRARGRAVGRAPSGRRAAGRACRARRARAEALRLPTPVSSEAIPADGAELELLLAQGAAASWATAAARSTRRCATPSTGTAS